MSSKMSKDPVRSAGSIRFQQVSKSFSRSVEPAVRNITLQVEPGELVVILGPSGCGKTTLLKMVNRMHDPDEGEILIGELAVRTLPVHLLRRQIGYVIQQVGLFPHMSIEKNISVVPRLLGWEKERIHRRIHDLLQLIGLPASYLSRYPRELSGGEQQRIGLARALAADPAILLMDEPFAALDAINRARLQGELLELQGKLKKTILFVTHDVEEAFRLASKIAVLRRGELVQYGTPLELVTRPSNGFVKELLGTENALRRLSLVTAHTLLQAKNTPDFQKLECRDPEDSYLRISPEEDLRSVVSKLLQSGCPYLPVTTSGGTPLGTIGLEDIQLILRLAL
ncbi:MAG: hypothetical protein Kow009_10080 [Spirochaetales bacterium]